MRAAKIAAITLVLLGAIMVAAGAVAATQQGQSTSQRRAGHGLGLGVRVLDSDGNAVEGAQVGIVKLNDDGTKSRSAHATTSSQGAAVFELRAGNYLINVHSDQGDAQQRVHLEQSQRVRLTVGETATRGR